MPSNPLAWFPMHVDDYLNDPAVMAMSADSEGCYVRLLLRSWKSQTPGRVQVDLVAEMAGLHRITPDRLPTVTAQIVVAFDVESEPGFWLQKRMVSEHAAAVRVSDARSRGGRTRSRSAGRTAGGIFDSSTRSLPGHLQDTSSYARVDVGVDSRVSKAEESEPTTKGNGKAEDPKSAKEEWLEAFVEDFYPDYPRKVKPDDARKAWLQMKPWTMENLEAIFAGLGRWKAYWSEHETPREKIPYPASFLRSGAWRGEAG
jgi:uncharacterized protein YdaU (DUF1376 family)